MSRKVWSYIGNIVQLTFVLSILISASAQVHDDESLEEGSVFITPNSSHIISSTESSTANSTSWEDGNWRRKDRSRIAAIAVYCSVILIAIFGILIKYFFTQYETLQAKAQLEYQQLRNVHIQ